MLITSLHFWKVHQHQHQLTSAPAQQVCNPPRYLLVYVKKWCCIWGKPESKYQEWNFTTAWRYFPFHPSFFLSHSLIFFHVSHFWNVSSFIYLFWFSICLSFNLFLFQLSLSFSVFLWVSLTPYSIFFLLISMVSFFILNNCSVFLYSLLYCPCF